MLTAIPKVMAKARIGESSQATSSGDESVQNVDTSFSAIDKQKMTNVTVKQCTQCLSAFLLSPVTKLKISTRVKDMSGGSIED